jgi:hypothetical protein
MRMLLLFSWMGSILPRTAVKAQLPDIKVLEASLQEVKKGIEGI